MNSKKCPEGKILNPKTNRCVNKKGKIGRNLLHINTKQTAEPNFNDLPEDIKENIMQRFSPGTRQNIALVGKQFKYVPYNQADVFKDYFAFPKFKFNIGWISSAGDDAEDISANTKVIVDHPVFPGKKLVCKLKVTKNVIWFTMHTFKGKDHGDTTFVFDRNGEAEIHPAFVFINKDIRVNALNIRLPLVFFGLLMSKKIDLTKLIGKIDNKLKNNPEVLKIIDNLSNIPQQARIAYFTGPQGQSVDFKLYNYRNIQEMMTDRLDDVRNALLQTVEENINGLNVKKTVLAKYTN